MSPEEFRATRERLGLSIRALAKELGVAHYTVFRWEHGERKIPQLAVLALKQIERKKR